MRQPNSDHVVPLARPRWGVVTRDQLLAAVCDGDLGFREVRAGRWQRLLPGIYLTDKTPPSLHARCHAALLHAGPASIITGTAGLALRRLVGPDDTPLEVTVLAPHATRVVNTESCHLLRTRRMPGHELVRVDGRDELRVARIDRCLVDALTRETDIGDGRAVATRVLRNRSGLWPGVQQLAAQRGPNRRLLRRVIRDLADGVRSAPEGQLHDVLMGPAQKGTLPPYLLNPDLYLDGELLGSPDAYFPGFGLGDEQDSRAHHGSRDALDETLLRHERFTRAGLHLNHTTPTRFARDPAAHVEKLVGLVSERRLLALPEPDGLVVLGRGPLLPQRLPWPQVDSTRQF